MARVPRPGEHGVAEHAPYDRILVSAEPRELPTELVEQLADEAVMVGDSWAADAIGALEAGIRPIWFNPLGRPGSSAACARTSTGAWCASRASRTRGSSGRGSTSGRSSGV